MDIKELRALTGMTQKQFADYFEIPVKTIQKWENGGKAPEYITKMMLKIIQHDKTNEEKLAKKSMEKVKTLFTSPNGTHFEYYIAKKRACVKVMYKNYLSFTIRFNNVPLFEHPYLSWQNYECVCSPCDENYLQFQAVQQHKKLVADIVYIEEDGFDFVAKIESLGLNASEVDIYTYIVPWQNRGSVKIMRYRLTICRKGSLADFYDMKEILKAYELHDIILSPNELERFKTLFSTPLIELYSSAGKSVYYFDFTRLARTEDSIINGLALGYPIESTVNFIQN